MVPHDTEAPSSKKSVLLDAFTQATGYNRKYAMWLLNHSAEVQPTTLHLRPPPYGSEVQHALFMACNAANRICAKRLSPFLPTLIETLERHGHLHLTEAYRNQPLGKIFGGTMRILTIPVEQS